MKLLNIRPSASRDGLIGADGTANAPPAAITRRMTVIDFMMNEKTTMLLREKAATLAVVKK